MSIWSSVGSDERVRALNCDSAAANYRGEGDPTLELGVATTSYHDLIRLSVFVSKFNVGPNVDVDVLLTAEAARTLAEWLTTAASGAASGGGS